MISIVDKIKKLYKEIIVNEKLELIIINDSYQNIKEYIVTKTPMTFIKLLKEYEYSLYVEEFDKNIKQDVINIIEIDILYNVEITNDLNTVHEFLYKNPTGNRFTNYSLIDVLLRAIESNDDLTKESKLKQKETINNIIYNIYEQD